MLLHNNFASDSETNDYYTHGAFIVEKHSLHVVAGEESLALHHDVGGRVVLRLRVAAPYLTGQYDIVINQKLKWTK